MGGLKVRDGAQQLLQRHRAEAPRQGMTCLQAPSLCLAARTPSRTHSWSMNSSFCPGLPRCVSRVQRLANLSISASFPCGQPSLYGHRGTDHGSLVLLVCKGSFHTAPHLGSPSPLCHSVLTTSSWKDPGHTGMEPTLTHSCHLTASLKALSPKLVTF